jgi:hypothetical protein
LELHKDSDTPKDDRWVTVWSTSRLADIAIRYEQTRTLEVRPDARNDEPTLTVAPGGTLTIPSGAIRLRHFPWRPFPPTTANLLILDHEGLPAELHEQSVAFPGFYLASELCLITGDYVAGSQQSTTASEQWIPDPTVPFELTNLTPEQMKATSLGLFAAAGIVGMLLLQFFGLLLLHR